MTPACSVSNWIDKIVYRLFYWRWNKILANRTDLRELLIAHLKAFDSLDQNTPVKITVSIGINNEKSTGMDRNPPKK